MLWAPCPGALTSLCLVLLQLKPLGCDGNSQPSVPAWLDSLGLQDYIQSFLSSGYSSIDTVKNLWELEIVNVSTAGVLPAFPPGLFLAGSRVHRERTARRGTLRFVQGAGKLGGVQGAAAPVLPKAAVHLSSSVHSHPPLPAGAEGEPARPSEEDYRLAGGPALRGATGQAAAVLAAESESPVVSPLPVVAGCFALPWLAFTFLPFLSKN